MWSTVKRTSLPEENSLRVRGVDVPRQGAVDHVARLQLRHLQADLKLDLNVEPGTRRAACVITGSSARRSCGCQTIIAKRINRVTQQPIPRSIARHAMGYGTMHASAFAYAPLGNSALQLAPGLGGQVETGAPGEIRTPDLLLRRQPLYPAELRAHGYLQSTCGKESASTFDHRREALRRDRAHVSIALQTRCAAHSQALTPRQE